MSHYLTTNVPFRQVNRSDQTMGFSLSTILIGGDEGLYKLGNILDVN